MQVGVDLQTVEIAHNDITDYQKTGVVCNGDVDCHIHHNSIGESATQLNLAANSVQIGFGGIGVVEFNRIAGNQWLWSIEFCRYRRADIRRGRSDNST